MVFLKNMLGYDDALDVFGVHGIGGIVGAILTGIFVNPALGGMGVTDYLAADNSATVAAYCFGTQMTAQIVAVIVAVVWTTVVTLRRPDDLQGRHRPARHRAAGTRRPRHRRTRRARLQLSFSLKRRERPAGHVPAGLR